MFTDVDYAITHAVQLSPRVPWAQVAPSLGLSETALARHWRGLVQQGHAWVTPAPGLNTDCYAGGIALVRCRHGQRMDVARRVAEFPEVATIDVTLGDWDLQLDLLAPDHDRLVEHVLSDLERVDGIVRMEYSLWTSVHREGDRWFLQVLDREQLSALRADPRSPTARPHPPTRWDSVDRAILGALTCDGRMPWSEVANRCGISSKTAQRRYERMQDSGAVQLRCHASRELADNPHLVSYFATVPSAQVEGTCETLRSRADCRLAMGISGRFNLYVQLWLRSLAGISTVEEEIAQTVPHLTIQDRLLVPRTTKRLGSMLDETGRRLGQGRIALW